MTTRLSEPAFAADDLPQLSAGSGGLLVAAKHRPGPSAARAGKDNGLGPYWWLPTPGWGTTETAMILVRAPGIRALTLNNDLGGPHRLAVAYCAHLTAARAAWHHPGPWITAVRVPKVPAGLVRLPHVVLTIDEHGNHKDVVVWELLTTHTASRWLGTPLPDLPVEQHLPALMGLRAAIRSGVLPDSHAGQRLGDLLTRRHLSTRLVLQHPDLFTELFEQRC
ncbi:hypothetical protein ACFY36_51300 [Actinoplanes sp. NPDC000266]